MYAHLASWDEDPGLEHAWVVEAGRRAEQLRTGEAHPIPADEVFEELQDLLG